MMRTPLLLGTAMLLTFGTGLAFAEVGPAILKVGAGWEVSAPPLVMTLAEGTGSILSIMVGGKLVTRGRGGIHFIDGKRRKELAVIALTSTETTDSTLSTRWVETTTALSGQYTIEVQHGVIRWHVNVQNNGNDQRWLEVRLGLPIEPAQPWDYWDGSGLPTRLASHACLLSGNASPVLRNRNCSQLLHNIAFQFPLNCAWTQEIGLAVGLEPYAIHSYYAGGAEPGVSSEDALYYATELVIDPHARESADFILFAFDPKYGYRGALERSYAAFPEAYAPDPAVDPRVGDGVAVASTAVLFQGQHFLWEDARRYHLGWTWGTSAHYGGLCYPDAEHAELPEEKQSAYWSFTNPRYASRPSWVGAAIAKRGGLTPAEARRYFTEAFRGAADALAVSSDATTEYCRQEVAQQFFPDSILLTRDGRRVIVPPSAIMYAWDNSFGRKHSALVGELVDSLEPAGLTFDNAVGMDRHYGAGADQSPGRAFDLASHRVYVVEGVAEAMQYAMAKRRTAHGKRLFIAANSVGTYFAARQVDVSLIESLGPVGQGRDAWRGPYTKPGAEYYMSLRYLLGSKPIVLFGAPPWVANPSNEEQSLPEAERERVFARAYDLATRDYPLFAYRTGALASSWWRPCAGVRRHMPTILKLAHAGWRPVPAASADVQDLWLERFGDGPGAFLTVGNPTAATLTSTLLLDHVRWHGAVALSTSDGAPFSVTVANSDSRIVTTVPARTPLAWRALATLHPPPPDGSIITGRTSDDESRLDINCPEAFDADVTVALPERHRLESLSLDGHRIAATTTSGGVSARLHFRQGGSTLIITHPPSFQVAPDAAAFPFFDGGRCASVIVLSRDATGAERNAAEHLSRYFQFYFAHTRQPFARPDMLWQLARDDEQIPIIDVHHIPTGVNLIVVGDRALAQTPGLPSHFAVPPGAKGGVWRDKTSTGQQLLVLAAKSGAALDLTLRALLEALDERYPL